MRRLHLPIHDPCHEDWDAMQLEGDAQRFCDVCTKQVHDLSAMTESQARIVLAEESAKGRVCVRYRADNVGNIRFLPEPARTTAAPSLWRMTVAAASLGLMMLTGCADSQPDAVNHDHCVYEVGPWSFTAERGQGTCPEPEEELLGKIAIEPPAPPPEPEVMGEAPQLEELEELGEIEPIEPERAIKGKIAAPVELMGDVAYDPEEAPCDPKPTPDPVPPELL